MVQYVFILKITIFLPVFAASTMLEQCDDDDLVEGRLLLEGSVQWTGALEPIKDQENGNVIKFHFSNLCLYYTPYVVM